jgi:hypothetical protein
LELRRRVRSDPSPVNPRLAPRRGRRTPPRLRSAVRTARAGGPEIEALRAGTPRALDALHVDPGARVWF